MPSQSSWRAALPDTPRFGIYVHWPFCQAKCPYCDFNSHVVASIDQDRWLAAYRSELQRVAALTGPRIVHSVFFGGGTPSLMAPQVVAGVLDEIRRLWPQANDVEVTLEANPTSVEAERFAGYRAAGVTRVSMGFQALRDVDLVRLGRLHSVAESLAAFEVARESFGRVSFDLIYGRQDQSLGDWETELREALALGPDHLSLYQLTIEPGTAFGARFAAGGLAGLPDEDLSADLYEVTQTLCEGEGLPAYEVSNHAKPGQESRHNLIYWTGGDYAGIGPGAHGRLTMDGARIATETVLAPGDWLRSVEVSGSGESHAAGLSPRDQAVELLMMGLRLEGGVDLNKLAEIDPDFPFDISNLVELGLVGADSGRLWVTKAGRPVLNAVLAELLPD